MSLLYVSQQMTIYVGTLLLLAGIIGNVMNIFIFSSVRTYRTIPCTFYFLIGSIFNSFYIIITLTIRVITTISGIELTAMSVVWCKMRTYLIGVLSLISFTCSCLATIAQFFVTSRNVNIRQCSNIKWAHRIVLIVISFWCLYNIPLLIFYDISPIAKICGNTNAAYTTYLYVYTLGYLCIFPIMIMVVFGYLAYRNISLIRALAEQHADRQITRMTLIQVALVVISITPYTIFLIYSLHTTGVAKDLNQRMIESLAQTITLLATYLYYIGTFYMFLISSGRFRETVKDRICWWRRQRQVIPFQLPARERRI